MTFAGYLFGAIVTLILFAVYVGLTGGTTKFEYRTDAPFEVAAVLAFVVWPFTLVVLLGTVIARFSHWLAKRVEAELADDEEED